MMLGELAENDDRESVFRSPRFVSESSEVSEDGFSDFLKKPFAESGEDGLNGKGFVENVGNGKFGELEDSSPSTNILSLSASPFLFGEEFEADCRGI